MCKRNEISHFSSDGKMLADWRSVEIRGDIWAACEWDTDRGENMCTLHWSTAERPSEIKTALRNWTWCGEEEAQASSCKKTESWNINFPESITIDEKLSVRTTSQIINVTESYRSIKLLRCDLGNERTFEANSFTLSRIKSQKNTKVVITVRSRGLLAGNLCAAHISH